jgi:hypothetical protein
VARLKQETRHESEAWKSGSARSERVSQDHSLGSYLASYRSNPGNTGTRDVKSMLGLVLVTRRKWE